MSADAFNLALLLYDLVDSKRPIKRWQDLEQLVVDCCKRQDPQAVHNTKTDPDVSLSNGFGIEAKSTTRITGVINLNSAAPDPKTFYVVAYLRSSQIKNVAIVSGQNFWCPEIRDIKKTDTRLRSLSNQFLNYRTRIMWAMKSPFEIWGKGNFVVDKLGVVRRY